MKDTDLKHAVLDALDYEPSIDEADIGVIVDGGIVSLTGHVATYEEKKTAERIVARIKGVRGIAQEIEVRPYGAHKLADDEIAQRAVHILHWNTAVPDERITVKVSHGIVTLLGTVEWDFQRRAAERALQMVPGIKELMNQIKVRPSASVSDIRERIERALQRDAEIEAEGIEVTVEGNTVTLKGQVRSHPERELVQRAAWAAPGVRDVQDRLELD